MSFEILDDDSIQRLIKENKRLKQELQTSREQSEKQRLDIVRMMAEVEVDNESLSKLHDKAAQNLSKMIRLIQRLIDLKEPGYIDHTERMLKTASYIAQRIGLDESAVENLIFAIYIHEVGIIAIPDHIIHTNENKLSADDRKLLQQQALIGARLLEKEDGFQDVARIIKNMNEHADGSGCPDGLVNDQIPIESKILLVVDTFNSLIYKRKNLLGVKQAMKFMEDKKDSYFDGRIVSILFDFVREHNLVNDLPKETAVSLSELKPGMILSRDLFSSSGVLLAPRGTKIAKDAIRMIQKFTAHDPILGNVYITI